MDFLQRKRIRLDADVYAIPNQFFSITISSYERKDYFRNSEVASFVHDCVTSGGLVEEARLAASCLMPDHLHLLIAPASRSLVKVIGQWKGQTTAAVRKKFGIVPLWQRSFFDHALRSEEDIRTVARYIVNNPVRKGLVSDWCEYPYAWCEWEA